MLEQSIKDIKSTTRSAEINSLRNAITCTERHLYTNKRKVSEFNKSIKEDIEKILKMQSKLLEILTE